MCVCVCVGAHLDLLCKDFPNLPPSLTQARIIGSEAARESVLQRCIVAAVCVVRGEMVWSPGISHSQNPFSRIGIFKWVHCAGVSV